MPPSTGSETPVIQRAAGEARKATTAAMSSPAAMRPSGVRSTNASVTPGRSSVCCHQRRSHHAGQHRVAADAARAQLQRGRAHQRLDPGLGGRVVGQPGDRRGGVDRRDQRERAAVDDVGRGRLQHVEGAGEVHGGRPGPTRPARSRAAASRARCRRRRRPRRSARPARRSARSRRAPRHGRARRAPCRRHPGAGRRRPPASRRPRAPPRRRSRCPRRRRPPARLRSRPPRHAPLEQARQLHQRLGARGPVHRRGGRSSATARCP